jgi:steroid delta-isomerase-like uncharacterized protein
MTRDATEALIRRYYDRFNAGDVAGMLALLTDDVVHDISQGGREIGRAAFAQFLGHMNGAYRERAHEPTVMVNADGSRAAAEFQLDGTYIATDGSLPAARGQNYVLTVGAFFEIRDGRIARVSNHYNMKDWLRQVERSA